MEIKEKIELRDICNKLLLNIVSYNILIHPELRYIQSLWKLGIIDHKYIQNEGYYIKDRFSEEPYDTIIRILPKIKDLIEENPEDVDPRLTIKRDFIISILDYININKEKYRYYDHESISKQNLSLELLLEIEEKFNKKVYYDQNGVCKIGTLCGIENDPEATPRYIIDTNNIKVFIPINASITKI